MEYGLLSVVPAIILVLFALKTRRTFEALIIGTCTSVTRTLRSQKPWTG